MKELQTLIYVALQHSFILSLSFLYCSFTTHTGQNLLKSWVMIDWYCQTTPTILWTRRMLQKPLWVIKFSQKLISLTTFDQWAQKCKTKIGTQGYEKFIFNIKEKRWNSTDTFIGDGAVCNFHSSIVQQLPETVECPVGCVRSGPLCIEHALGYIIMRLWEPSGGWHRLTHYLSHNLYLRFSGNFICLL